ncbi:hypothetical protein CLOBOL_06403 [Enterocloster bolteae ATCC BAA-613]|uniref:Uncharacterized protein n=1 Tax=Enterocloster bolteae (strain ATCC BAA-613 / DSM 15670 / CCUG 46953 / JCM 12243 / WAL 16351) TaxID=411902 RepID=A8S2U4_ENTBW|nr:hypothetical protein CLOBOL_06403 [Enterocloster bolteae ATCC BAA-613]
MGPKPIVSANSTTAANIKKCGWPDLNRHGIATEGF